MLKFNRKSTITIGLLIDWVDHQYQFNLLRGVFDCAKKHGVNLICFEGSGYHTEIDVQLHFNSVYEKATADNVDGIIMSAGSISYFVEEDWFENYIARIHPLPVVSISKNIPGVPSVLIDNNKGISDLLLHLIEVHGLKEFAFIKGPEGNFDADQRYKIFNKTLQDHNIAIGDDRIVSGDFSYHAGIEAVKTLLDERKVSFDAVVAADDLIALGAIEELRNRNIKIPWDIAVTGFDDDEGSSFSNPPLTTIRQPIYQQGAHAVEMLLRMIKKGIRPENQVLPTSLIIRESCGCISEIINKSSIPDVHFGHEHIATTLPKYVHKIAKHIIKNINHLNIDLPEKYHKYIHDIILAINEEINNKHANTFIIGLNQIFHIIIQEGHNIFQWQMIISEISKHIIPLAKDQHELLLLENLFNKARILIGEKSIIEEKKRQYDSLQKQDMLNAFRDKILISQNIKEQIALLQNELPNFGFKSCYLTLKPAFGKDKDKTLYLIFGYNQDGAIDAETSSIVFSADKLLPENIINKKKPRSHLVMSLGSTYENLGFLIFEFDIHSIGVYGKLRRIINSALQGAILFSRVADQTKHLKIQKHLLVHSLSKSRKTMIGFVKTLALTIETRDPYTAGHQKRVAGLAKRIANEMKLSKNQVEAIHMAGLIHDLGKIYIPAEILNKPGDLREIEFNLIKDHPRLAYDILKHVEFPWPIADIILQHHERINGSGYPNGLKGDEILLEAKIIHVADVIEAMASHRPYRPILGIEAALEEITKYRGVYYDEEIVDICLVLFNEKGYTLKAHSHHSHRK